MHFEQEWEMEVNDLPYKLEGWSKGQGLAKMDPKVLEEKVVDFHKKLWEILNAGKGDAWINLTKKRLDENMIYDYYNANLFNKEITTIKEDVQKYAKNTMIPRDDYQMKLYANGKLVTLERKNHTREFNNQNLLDIKGWSPLISKGKVSGAADYPVLLYLPEGSNEFVIIRK